MQPPAKASPKGIPHAYAEATRAAVESYNADLARIEAERQAIASEQAAILAAAIGGEGDAAKLRKRRDALRDRTLAADIQEYAVLKRLPPLDAMARVDWKAEETKQRQHEAERRAVLETAADTLGSETRQRNGMILEDKARRQHEEGAKAAARSAQTSIITPADRERIADLERDIAAVLR